jgi:integral membrane protein
MPPLLSTAVGRLRVVSAIEGLSYVLLMGVAMPLKYMAGIPEVVRVVGMAHGVLFVAFVVALQAATISARWSPLRAAWVLFLSLIPLGALRIEHELRRDGATAA